MISELVINEVNVRIWEGSSAPAPSSHPLRSHRIHPHRQIEFDMIDTLIPPPWSWDDIEKEPLGKPFLKNDSHHIGISHSNGLGCFAWSKKTFGVDIQTPHPSIFKVRKKFCNPSELEYLVDSITDARYLMLWSAKEAIYKFYGQGVDFSHDLSAELFKASDDKIFIRCQNSNDKYTTFIVHCLKQPNYILSIAYENNL